MRPLFSSLALAAILLTACNVAHPEPIRALEKLPTPVQVNTSVPSTTAILLQHRPPLLRIAILGGTTTTNIWVIFDSPGADYWNVAIQSSYWPSLYPLTPTSTAPSTFSGRPIQPVAAQGEPSSILCDAVSAQLHHKSRVDGSNSLHSCTRASNANSMINSIGL